MCKLCTHPHLSVCDRYNRNQPGGPCVRADEREGSSVGKIRKSVGEKLRELRESNDLTQSQIAAALGVDRSTYTRYELNDTPVTLETLTVLAQIFGVPTEQLLPDEDDGDKKLSLRDVARPNSMLQSLSKEERGLIVFYRTLDKDAKAQLRREIAKLAKKEE